MKKIIAIVGLILGLCAGHGWALTSDQVLTNAYNPSTKELRTSGTITGVNTPVWQAQPNQTFKTIDMTILAGQSGNYNETWVTDPVPGYEVYLEYITIIRDETSTVDYYNYAVYIGANLALGGEIAPASTNGIFQPPVSINLSQFKNYQVVVRNKSGQTQIFKVGIILSNRKKNL
ncbi:MAG: hypothetical protein WC623_24190 [Pedobacter sp.]|uniref:hypothetical protein n=1 Tax=Pedobacter sp. TaxID=1411316 RepID=UPI00356377A7